MSRRTIALVALVTLLMFSATGWAAKYDKYGKITPNQPYDIWLDITADIPLLTPNAAKSRAINRLKAKKFSGKSPADVLKALAKFRGALDRARAKVGLPKTPIYRSPSGEKVSPAIVYINSGDVLDSVVQYLLKANPGNEAYRANFAYQYPKGKTPSDVYELVDLGIRRLDLAL